MAKSRDYINLITSTRWRKLRYAVLTYSPLCCICKSEGRLKAACEVHHKRPVEYGLTRAEKERLMFDPMNLQALCHECHVAEHRAMGRSGRAAQKRRNIQHINAITKRFFE